MRISRALLDEIVRHAHAAVPHECCGLVAGRDGVPTRVLPVRNAASRPEVTYEMDPVDQHRAYTDIEDAGEDLVAIYHSHPPAGAYFSETDMRMAYLDGDLPACPRRVYILAVRAASDSGQRGAKPLRRAPHPATEPQLGVG